MNNFDTSSTGCEIELTCAYDYDAGRIYYEEFEQDTTRLDFGRDNHVFLLGNADALYYKKSSLNKMSKQEVFDLCEQYDLLGYSYDIDRLSKAEYIEELLNITVKQYYEYAIAQHGWYSFREAIQHDWYVSNGYSQGDSVYIISLDEALTNDTRAYVNHVLWDSPICMRVYVNNKVFTQEFYEDDLLEDPYTFDRDDVINKIQVLPINTDAKSWLISNLPDYPQA